MAVPTSSIALTAIYGEANSGYSSGQVSILSQSFFSYFAGPNGSNSISYNAWGEGEGSGANRIYGLSAKTTNYAMGDFSGLTYFYDQSSYACILNVNNNLGPSVPFPPPPTDTNVQDVNLTFRDSSNTYQYLAGSTGTVISLGNGGGNASADVSQPTSPLIRTAYWTITVGSSPQFPGATADLTVNGNSIFTGQAISAGPTPTTFDFTTWGSIVMAASYGGTVAGFYFDLTIY